MATTTQFRATGCYGGGSEGQVHVTASCRSQASRAQLQSTVSSSQSLAPIDDVGAAADLGGGANVGAVNVSLGGAGGAGGEGGTVTLISKGDSVTTGGTLGYGLAAASIGGSGGKGGGALSATLVSAGDVNVTLGGAGGDGGGLAMNVE